MALFNYGIDCLTEDDAKEIANSISSLEIYQDGLDTQEERISVISNQALKLELKKIAQKNAIAISVEIWPEDEDFDDAESNGNLETFTYP